MVVKIQVIDMDIRYLELSFTNPTCYTRARLTVLAFVFALERVDYGDNDQSQRP